MLHIILYISALICVLVYVRSVRRRQCTLPGPRGLPIIGYLPFLKQQNVHLQYDQLAKVYSPGVLGINAVYPLILW